MPFHPPPYFTLPKGSYIKLTEARKTIYAAPNPEEKPMLVSCVRRLLAIYLNYI